MNVSSRAACLRQLSAALAAVLLPAMAAGAPIPDLRMGLDRTVSYHSTAAFASDGAHPLESLWSTLSESPGLRAGRAEGRSSGVAAALSWIGGASGAGGGSNAMDSMISGAGMGSFGAGAGRGARSKSKGIAPLTAGILQANDNHGEFDLDDSEATAALAATLPFGQFTGEGDAIALAIVHHQFAGRAAEWASARVFSNPGRGHLKTDNARNADQGGNGNAGNHQGEQESGPTGDAPAVTAVPEPNSLLLLGTGAAALLVTARRRKLDR